VLPFLARVGLARRRPCCHLVTPPIARHGHAEETTLSTVRPIGPASMLTNPRAVSATWNTVHVPAVMIGDIADGAPREPGPPRCPGRQVEASAESRFGHSSPTPASERIRIAPAPPLAWDLPSPWLGDSDAGVSPDTGYDLMSHNRGRSRSICVNQSLSHRRDCETSQ
jgi:hypothetical protein